MSNRRGALAGAVVGIALALTPLLALGAGTWNLQRGSIDGGLHGVWFADSKNGIAVGENGASGNRILRTTNGGATWAAATTVPATDTLTRVFLSDKSHGLAVGEGAILRTSDGGDHWTEATSGVPTSDLEAVFMFPDNKTAYASGASKVLVKSTDGGATWNDASAGLPTINATGAGPVAYAVDAMWWTSKSEGWLAGNRVNLTDPGLILHTLNGGTTWSVVNSNTNIGGYESMMFTDSSHGWAVGGCSEAQQIQKTPVRPSIASVCGAMSRWNGTTWVDVSPSAATSFELQGVWFLDAKHGWTVGETTIASATKPRVILFSADGGTTWTKQADNGPADASAGLSFVHAVDICHAWAVGGDSLILGFTDTCPVSASASPTPSPTLPRAGQSGSRSSTNWLLAAIVATGLLGAAGAGLRLRTR